MKRLSYFLILLFSYSSLFAQLYEQSVRSIVEALATDSLEKAKGMIEQTIRLDPMKPSNAILYQYLGGIYQKQGQNEKALEAYSKGLELSPTSLDLLLNRASLYLQLNNEERALNDYNKVLEGAKTTKLLDFVVIPGIILMVVCSVIIGNELWNEFEDELLVYSVILTVILTVEAIIYYRSIKSQMKLVIDEGGNDEVKNR